VARCLTDFADGNKLKLRSPRMQLSDSDFFEMSPFSLTALFEDSSDIDVLNLYYQIHPTEGRVSLDESMTDFSNLNTKEILYLVAAYAKKHSLRMQPTAYCIEDYADLVSAVQMKNFARNFFRCKPENCVELVDIIQNSGEKRIKEPIKDYEMKQLEASFSRKYRDPWDGVDHFVQYVKDCCKEYRTRPLYFAPYIALVQCSGSGKSRLLLESSKKLRALYVCFRTGTTGYPPRSTIAISALFDGLNRAKDEEAYKKALAGRLKQAEISARKHLPTPETAFAGGSTFESEQLCEKVWDLESIDLEKEKLPVSQDPVLLIFDEARELLNESPKEAPFGLNKFRLIQKALRAYWEDNKNAMLFAVLVDTSSKINAFPPSSKVDPPARQFRDDGGALLLHPFVWRGSFDAIFHDLKLPDGTRDLTSLLTSSNYLQAGRPLVALPFPDTNQQRDFLLRKLRGGFQGRDSMDPGRNLGYLSIMLVRLATTISCHCKAAAELVAEHMVHLLASDVLREQMFVSHLVEPRLASAASVAWNTEGYLEQYLLPELQRALISGLVSAGDRGEVVAQMVLLIAFDTACILNQKNPGECVPLVTVLEQLLPEGSQVDVRNAIPHSLHDASVACGQFVQLAHQLSLNTNVQLAERHCGALFKAKQPGVDAVVPIIASVSAMVLFQFKNLAKQGKASADQCSAMYPSVSLKDQKISKEELFELDKKCVRVFMHLGAYEDSAECSGEDSTKSLQIFGLSSRCLSEPVVRSLEMLLDASNSIESFVLDQKAALEVGVSCIPFPDDISDFRKILPFVIDNKPQWSDLTVVELQSKCKENGLSGIWRLRKQALIKKLMQEVGSEPRDKSLQGFGQV